mmetsp:Transcript_8704/g.23980  ORF Transcript_8704/g.23980 Transcript_8704/m.23980 type:complete len:527 (-) Transcript_8704:137-1717(-)|eukprot:CAMPEP_0185185412 /NCGR_PEP_ID=MMETSP1140-20130426/3275_1 /TAXON_ID=298111 /ORGANISM="Pavlova sp., Strain CCMP459" /LENGTH=526 /DNA_ID=CAMNT_0027751595 /DNA_START=23 /DNA_END=1603 /DNA_ORIENTATION=-
MVPTTAGLAAATSGLALAALLTSPAPASGSCPPGGWSKEVNGLCHKISGKGTLWECEQECEREGGFLTCVASHAEQRAIAALGNLSSSCCGWQSTDCCFWVGLTQTDTSGEDSEGWEWTSSVCESDHLGWRDGEPSDKGDEDCALMGWEGAQGWLDVSCTMRAACVCGIAVHGGENSPAPPPAPAPPPLQSGARTDKDEDKDEDQDDGQDEEVRCQDGWAEGPKELGLKHRTCFKVLPENMDWFDCSVECEDAEEAHMACAPSQAASEWLQELSRSRVDCCNPADHSCCVWIGLSQSDGDDGPAEHWDEWEAPHCIGTEPLWAPGDPNDYMGMEEDCALMGWQGQWRIVDAPCWGALEARCVCQKDPTPGGRERWDVPGRSGHGQGHRAGVGPGAVLLLMLMACACGCCAGIAYGRLGPGGIEDALREGRSRLGGQSGAVAVTSTGAVQLPGTGGTVPISQASDEPVMAATVVIDPMGYPPSSPPSYGGGGGGPWGPGGYSGGGAAENQCVPLALADSAATATTIR